MNIRTLFRVSHRNRFIESFRKNRTRLQIASRYPDRKWWFVILFELVFRSSRKIRTKYEYMELGLFRKGSGDPGDYVPFAEWDELTKSTDVPSLAETFDNKIKFDAAIKKAGLPGPGILGVFSDGRFELFDGGEHRLSEVLDAGTALSLIKQAAGGEAFAKRYVGFGGSGAFRIYPDTTVEEFVEKIEAGDFLFQRYLDQHEVIRSLHPDSLNTLRLTTVISDKNGPEIIAAYIRVGVGNSGVDNMAAGGLAFPIDIETGRMDKVGFISISFGGGVTDHHPTTGRQFEEREIPFFGEAIELAITAARALPNPIVGWDVAICPEGPILIEGNRRPNVWMDQVMCGPYRKRPVISDLIAKHLDNPSA